MSSVSVPIIVLSSKQDDVEYINRVLREGGHAAHCHWITELSHLSDAIKSIDPHLLWVFCDNFADNVRAVVNVKNQISSTLPLIAVRNDVPEQATAAAMAAGAHDLVSRKFKDRVRTVAERELRAFRLERALSTSVHSARQYKEQLRAFMQGSVDAIAHVHDGVLVEANQAWADLFGYSIEDVIGPLMDHFDSTSHAALKGALVASAKGQWTSEPLKATALTQSGSTLPLTLLFESSIFDGEPAIKLSIPRESSEQSDPEDILEQAISIDPATGFYHRIRLVELLKERLAVKQTEGVRALAYIRPDKFSELVNEFGPVASEEFLVQLSEILKELAHNNDLCGRFGGNIFLIMLDRGTTRDVEAWAEHVVTRIAETRFTLGNRRHVLTCTIGLSEAGPSTEGAEALITSAYGANERGRQRGGNRVVFEEPSDESTRTRRFDEVWTQQIRTALVEDRFQLSRLQLANLNANHANLFDTVLKILDDKGEEVGASIFMPVAARHNLLRPIDRWVVHKILRMSTDPAIDGLFVRLSSDSICDNDFLAWLSQSTQSLGAVAQRVCFQVSEDIATQYLPEACKLSQELRQLGFKFAIENFGIGRQPQRVLAELSLDYLKIDGSLMQGLADDRRAQARISEIIENARAQGVTTIGERVEDANTMAVLFQLGVGYVQGHYVREPEVVLEDLLLDAV